MTKTIAFWVPGIPRPGGSKRAFYNPRLGRAMIVDACSKNKEWRAAVAWAAKEVFSGTPLRCPLRVSFKFEFTRPASHFGTGKNSGYVRDSAPSYKTTKPDVTKLVRSTEDALTGILWVDDSQIVNQTAWKRYGDRNGCQIEVEYEEANSC